MISTGFMVIGSNMLQSHLLSTTTMKRLLLGICWITKDLPEGERDVNVMNVWESGQQGSLGPAVENAGRVSGRLVSPLAVSKHTDRLTQTQKHGRIFL